MDTDADIVPQDDIVPPSGSEEVAEPNDQDWSRFDRIMHPHLKHSIITDAKEEQRMILAAQQELAKWDRETRPLARPGQRTYKSERWNKARQAWRRDASKSSSAGAVEALLAKNYRLILAMAHKHRIWGARRGYDVSDLFNIATMGFVRAIVKFDPTKKVRLSTYSAWWMKSVLGRELHENSSIINVPCNLAIAASLVSSAIADFQSMHGRDPTDTEVAQVLRRRWNARIRHDVERQKLTTEEAANRFMSEEDAIKRILDFRRIPKTVASIDAPINESGGTIMDVRVITQETGSSLKGVDWENNAFANLESRETAQLVIEALGELTELERWVVRNRYIVEHENEKDGTLKRLGETVPPRLVAKGHQITRERVRQIEVEALAKMRAHLASRLDIK
jgi:RNA polymerase sigma factor (sigma-70 family)